MADEGEDETCDQTKQIPWQVSLYYVALFVEELIIFPLQATSTVYEGGEYYLRATVDRKYRPSSGKS